MNTHPMSMSKDDYADIIRHISLSESPVGIDAQLTHAIIIEFLKQISHRLADIESRLNSM